MRSPFVVLSVFFVLCFTIDVELSSAQSRLVIPRIQGELILDGLSDEPAWEHITPYTYVVHKPSFGDVPAERTELLIAYDDEYLYVAGRMYDREPEKIASSSKKRDTANANSQWFGIALDTFNDKENGVAFFTTPSGLRWDGAISLSSVGDVSIERSWNTFWDVEVTRTSEGWFAEFRIPISSLRFQDTDGYVVMGLTSWRSVQRRNETYVFPAISPHWGERSFYRMPEAQEIVFEHMRSRKPLQIAPYAAGGVTRTNDLNASGTAYKQQDTSQLEAGLDMKYGVTSNLTLDVTLNTDFAQVEADDEQINLTRYSLFFPEKRLFFQERASIFDFNFEATDDNRLFYSRRIGIHDGNPVRIYGGARVVGRVGVWDMGVLDMQTEAVDDIPSENFGVFRVRRQLQNSNSYVGAMTTSRNGMDGSYNVAYGLDGVFCVHDDDYLTVKWAQTFADTTDNNVFSLDPGRFFAVLSRRSMRGFGYGLAYSYAGKTYQPGVGFELRENYSRYAGNIRYGIYPGESSRFFHLRPSITSTVYVRNADGSIESLLAGPAWYMETRSGYQFSLRATYYREEIQEVFSISDQIDIVPDTYDYVNGSLSVSEPSGRTVSTGMSFTAGSYYDGTMMSASISPVWNVSSSLELNGMYQVSHLDLTEPSDFTGHIGRVRALYMLNTDFSISSYVQYNSATDDVVVNARLRYNPREGTDLYLVYNEVDTTHRHDYQPVMPVVKNRTVLLKYTYMFNL